MNINKRIFAVCFIAVVCIQCLAQSVRAETVNKDSRVSYSVKAILPDNQTDKYQSFFDLRMKPGGEQTLDVQIFNSGVEDITVDVTLNTASSNPGGSIDYSRPGIRDESMKIDISEISTIVKPQITIPAGESRTAQITVKMPQEEFQGVLLGGIHFTKTSLDDADGALLEKGYAGVLNEYAYVIALKLSLSDAPVTTQLNFKKAEASLVNYKTALVATIQNSEAVIMKDIAFEAKVFRSDSNEPIREAAKTGVDMAPNSVYDFSIDWNNSRFQPGNYTLAMKATHEGKVWEWNEAFTIAGAKAGEVNNDAIDLDKTWFSDTNLLIAAAFSAMLIAILFIIIAAGKRRRREKAH